MAATKLVIASILKPVDDIRMYKKFALTLVQTYKYEINIVGFYSKSEPPPSNVTLHPLYNFARISFARLFAPLRFLAKVVAIKPKIVIINTHELLLPAVTYKIFSGAKLIYDIRENYFLNIWYGSAFPPLFKQLLAMWVRLKEILTSPFISRFILAEKIYATQIPFGRKRQTIIENKALASEVAIERVGKFNLLYSGTIAPELGIFEAINFAKQLQSVKAETTLTINGYCPNLKTLKMVKRAIADSPFIKLKDGTQPVPHDEIMAAIAKADFGLAFNQDKPHIFGCIPTKVYEYAAQQLPIVTTANQSWAGLVESEKLGVLLADDIHETLNRLASASCYPNGVPRQVLWHEESSKLTDLMKQI